MNPIEKGAPAPTGHPFESPNHSSLDNCKNSQNERSAQEKSRLKFLARRLHALGPKPLFHFLDELERGAPMRAHLEEYAALPVELVRARGGDDFGPLVLLLQEPGR